MFESKVDYQEIQKILEQYTVTEKVLKIPAKVNKNFVSWSGASFDVFRQKVHPKYIQKKLEGKQFQPDLFNEVKEKDLFLKLNVSIEKWKTEDEVLEITYSFIDSFFGEILIASTSQGICWLAFVKDKKEALQELTLNFTNSLFRDDGNLNHSQIVKSIFDIGKDKTPVKIHLKGSDFQYKVWKALVEIPLGELTTYGAIAERIQMPVKASRAVGTAIGKNTIAFIIPCHRVVRSSGLIGDFRWGNIRKKALIGWEALQLDR